jgi:hypothetical protein
MGQSVEETTMNEIFMLLDTLLAKEVMTRMLFSRDLQKQHDELAVIFEKIFNQLKMTVDENGIGDLPLGVIWDLYKTASDYKSLIMHAVDDLEKLVGRNAAGNVFCHVAEQSRRLEVLTKQELQERCEKSQ